MNESLLTVESLIDRVKNNPEKIDFKVVMAVIDQSYIYSPTAFANGALKNMQGANEGSCKIFAFAKLHNLNKEETLSLFGDYYRVDVLQHPNGNDHQNIRNFMISGWAGISFDSQALTAK